MAVEIKSDSHRNFANFNVLTAKDAVELCSQHLLDGTTWIGLKESDVRIERQVGGSSNTVYLVENLSSGAKVIVRFFGCNISRLDLIKTLSRTDENLCYYIMGIRGCGPKLHSLIPDGRIEEYFPGDKLSKDTIVNDVTFLTVARKVAQINYKNLDMPVIKRPLDYLDTCFKIMEEVERKMSTELDVLHFVTWMQLTKGIDIKKELEWLKQLQPSIRTRVVFLHNDLNNGNILVDPKDPSNVMVIDMHVASFGFRGSDIGSFFAYCMMETTAKDLSNGLKFPSKERRILFVNEYLDECKKLKPDLYDPVLDSLDVVMRESLFFGAVYSLLGVLWIARDAEKYTKEWPGLVTGCADTFALGYSEVRKEL